MNALFNWFRKNRIDGTLLEKIGTVHGTDMTDDRINIEIFKKRMMSDNPVVRVGMKVGGFGDVYAKSTDLTKDEAEKLIVLLQNAVDRVDKQAI